MKINNSNRYQISDVKKIIVNWDIENFVISKNYKLYDVSIKAVYKGKYDELSISDKAKELEFFIDEQRVGPYKLWHHQHFIEPIKGGVLMRDIVTYSPPFGFLGALANKLIIRKKLNEIFDYRTLAVNKKFGQYEK